MRGKPPHTDILKNKNINQRTCILAYDMSQTCSVTWSPAEAPLFRWWNSHMP